MIEPPVESQRHVGFFGPLIGDGRPLLLIVAGGLAFAGGFALFLAVTREFLPQDIHYLGMSAKDLCGFGSCRVVDFMVHDRAAWGGTMLGTSILWAWIVMFPLSEGESWAWWTLALSGATGFASFLAYLDYGYLDPWHAIGMILLLVPFIAGMVRVRRRLGKVRFRALVQRRSTTKHHPFDLGWWILLSGALGTAIGGLSILWIGVTSTFVPEDLEFMRLSAPDLAEISGRLVPLIAHDRVGFGGGVFVMGLTTALCLWFAPPARHLWEAVALAGTISLAASIGVHFVVGYTDLGHLLPAVAAAADLIVGLALTGPRLLSRTSAGPAGSS